MKKTSQTAEQIKAAEGGSQNEAQRSGFDLERRSKEAVGIFAVRLK